MGLAVGDCAAPRIAHFTTPPAGGPPALPASQSSQKRDQGLAVRLGKVEAVAVPRDRSRFHPRPAEPCRHVVALQASRIEPVLERGHRAGMFERTAVPEPLERRDLVETGPASSVKSKAGVRPHAEK